VAVVLIKAGVRRPESAKQAEIRLASLLKILTIAPAGRPKHRAGAGKGEERLYFRKIPPYMANSGGIAGFVN
jgi:hypothetical protein